MVDSVSSGVDINPPWNTRRAAPPSWDTRSLEVGTPRIWFAIVDHAILLPLPDICLAPDSSDIRPGMDFQGETQNVLHQA